MALLMLFTASTYTLILSLLKAFYELEWRDVPNVDKMRWRERESAEDRVRMRS